MINLLLILIFLIFGVTLGYYLSRQGVTADNALNKYQKYLIWVVLIIGFFAFAIILIGKLKLIYFIPLIIRLMIGAYLTGFVLMIGGFGVGLLLGLELPAYHSSPRMKQLFLGLIIITIPLSILLHYSLPVTNKLGELKVVDGVVLQTTDSTCAPASIATLVRWFGENPNLSEKEVIKLTKTNHFGTNTLREIYALSELGFNPQFRENLTLDDLIKINQPALLHVLENVNGNLINHAVALLSIYEENKLFKIGNPLYGLEEKTETQMKTYWSGEAIFINPKHKSQQLTKLIKF
jgi:predicted double-glycine peptidase